MKAVAPSRTLFRSHVAAMVILILGLGVRLAVLRDLALRAPTFGEPIVDSEEYERMAVGLLQGHAPRGPFFRPPLYPVFIAAVYRATGGRYAGVMVVQAVIGAVGAALLFRLALNWGLPPALSFASGMLLALYGPLVFYELQMLPAGLAVFFLVGMLFFGSLGRRSGAPAYLAAGACGALAALCVPMYLPVGTIPVAGALLAHRGKTFLRGPAWAALFGFMLPLLPVVHHNYRETGMLIPVAVNGGVNLYLANNPRSDSTCRVRPGPDWDYLYSEPRSRELCDTAAADRWFYSRALTWIGEHPGRFLRAYLTRLQRLLAARELPRTFDLSVERRHSALLRILTAGSGGFFVPFGLLAPLAIAGLPALFRAAGRSAAWLAAYTILAIFYLPVFIVCSRYRLVLAPAICLLAPLGARSLFAHSSGIGRPLAVLSAVLAGILVNRPITAPLDGFDLAAEQRVLLGLKQMRAGDDPAAREHFAVAHSRVPGWPRALHAWGLLRMRGGLWQKAVRCLEAAVEADPDFAEAHLNLAVCLERLGQTRRAKEQALMAAQLRPRLWKAHDMLGALYLREGRLWPALRSFYRAHSADRCVAEPLAHILYLLSAHPDPRVRNGAVADKLARRLSRHATNRALALDVLAMWAAERGRFGEAVQLSLRAAAACARTDPDYSRAIRSRLGLFRRARPFRDPSLPFP